MIVAIDFDGTCVTHEYPKMGRDIGAIPWLLKAQALGNCQFVLLTMRDQKELADAVTWFQTAGIQLWGVNENPQQASWTTSRKVYAHLYIDDAALGVPLVVPEPRGLFVEERPYVNWRVAGPTLLRRIRGILPKPRRKKEAR